MPLYNMAFLKKKKSQTQRQKTNWLETDPPDIRCYNLVLFPKGDIPTYQGRDTFFLLYAYFKLIG